VSDSADDRGTLAALRDVDRETVTSVDYWYWEAEEPLETGCRFGGTVRYTPIDSGARLRFEDCSWSRGLAFSGTGRIDDDAGTLTMRLRETGNEEDVVRYRRDADGRSSVEGVDVDVGGGAP
jgi:hypothetical protein